MGEGGGKRVGDGMAGGRSTAGARLRLVAQAAQRAVPECAGVGLAVVHGHRVVSAATTTDLARALESFQCEAGEGPCLDAIRLLQVFNVDPLSCAVSWPRFGRMAGEKGIRSCLAVPVTVGGRARGAMSLYSHSRDAFVGYEHTGVVLAAEAATALSEASSPARAEGTEDTSPDGGQGAAVSDDVARQARVADGSSDDDIRLRTARRFRRSEDLQHQRR